ncbi:MAG: methyltransferase domain-containing protein [Deltaproteobacteria bacterium]|uniref:Methyltransferase domain-containing protein n=1 Tax=Candidatus Zymogenus saltonus TaxID=2844893 RepID=A0A9D8KJS7_9DELT|nr:methyltransferase domain-containing protein [Candidatus Zymogenus saltonus]
MEDGKRANKERRFWRRFAPRYDRFVEKQVKISYQILIGKILDEIEKGNSVLEVAAGTGLIALEVAGKAGEVKAVDITPEMVRFAEKKAKERSIKNTRFSVGDAYALPFDDGSFDAAVCSNALHNMMEPKRALTEMRRVLKKGGKLITPTYCHGEGLKSRMLSRLMSLSGFPGYHRFTIESLSGLISDSGFEIEKIEIIEDRIPLAFIVGRPKK